MTAIEWLVQEINKINVSTEARMFINKLEKQAKEMEKQQIFETWDNGFDNGLYQGKYNENCETNCGEQYYNETFNKETI